MFWADRVAQDLKKRKLPLEWVDDMKTPSGRIHVGALRGVVIHDLVYKALLSKKVKATYTYVFDNHDPMDALPIYLPKEKFGKYLGMPLYEIPSPAPGFESFAKYYAQEFIDVFNAIGCSPKILWATELYLSGKMNSLIKKCLDKADVIRGIYEELYKRKMPSDWFPFQVFCPKCGKVSTTRVNAWDGERVSFFCEVERLEWTKGCGFKNSISPFSSINGIAGKLPWKVEWACKWKAIGVTVEGAGKDHMSRGGSHDLASLICKRVIDYPIPYPIAYEWFLVGGKKMSTSKGVGSSASEMLEILPPELLRFLMVKTRINQAINFDPSGYTIPNLFREYQEAAVSYFGKGNEELARIFELSQIDGIKKPPINASFINLAGWVQMPNAEDKIREYNMEEWVPYAKIYNERFAPDEAKFELKKELPEKIMELSNKQKEFIGKKVLISIDKYPNPEDLQKSFYQSARDMGLSSTDAFAALYIPLLGKDYGPKVAWIILQNKDFAIRRYREVLDQIKTHDRKERTSNIKILNKEEVFSIDDTLREKYPSISIGIAVIKGVTIKKSDPGLEKEKRELLASLEGLTTDRVGHYPEIQSYRRLYKETGVDWHSRRPSPEALLRRVALKKGLYLINTCVDAYNLVVMKHRVSIGAFDLDKIEFPTVLRFAKNGEEILLLGDDQPTKYKEGEIAYFDKIGGYNIDFNYRDAQRTAVQLTTKNLYINVDGVYDITPSQVERSLQEACDMILRYCGGKVEIFGIEFL